MYKLTAVMALFIFAILLQLGAPITVSAQRASLDSKGLELSGDRFDWDEDSYFEAINYIETHMLVGDDDQIVLTVNSNDAVRAGINSDLFDLLTVNLKATNKLVADGRLELADISLSTGMNLLGDTVPLVALELPNVDASSCAGQTAGYQRWYGWAIYTDNCVTGQIVGLTQQISGAAGICSLLALRVKNIPVATLCVAAGEIVDLGGGYIANVNANGNYQGVVFDAFWNGSIFWVSHQ